MKAAPAVADEVIRLARTHGGVAVSGSEVMLSEAKEPSTARYGTSLRQVTTVADSQRALETAALRTPRHADFLQPPN